jgi:hypothetical protein
MSELYSCPECNGRGTVCGSCGYGDEEDHFRCLDAPPRDCSHCDSAGTVEGPPESDFDYSEDDEGDEDES